jgi:N-acetylglucosamine-1-phosphate uridyltransferase (contains nucleotidyltransferase and I-patch acetyltransferase domains)
MDTTCPTTDAARRALGFMTLDETMALADRGVTIPAPHSVLISPGALLEEGIVLWPGTVLQCLDGGRLSIGAGTICFPSTRIVAAGGRIAIGPGVEIGDEGGFTIKAEGGAEIVIGAGARLLGGGSLTLSNRIGRGSQILGPIRCQNCRLGDGGTYRDPDPDSRGGVLKGAGVARDLEVPQGRVIQAFGLFAEAPVRPQSYFHPPAKG